MDRHPEYGVKVLPVDLNPETCPPEKLAWSPVFSGPNERGRNYVPEIGQLCLIEDNHFVAGPSGSNFHPVVAVLNPALNKQGGLPGNFNMMQAWNKYLTSVKNGIGMPAEVSEEGDPVVRKRKDSGDFSMDKTKGMPAHASVAQTFGMILPQIKNISTAVDQFTSVLNGNILGSFPGVPLGNILSTLSNNPAFQQVLSKLPSEVQDAYNTISSFSRSVQGGMGGYGYSLGARVNEQVFSDNAIRLISQVKDAAQLSLVLQELRSNNMLHGCETLENKTIYVEDTESVNVNVSSNTVTSNTVSANVSNSAIVITSCGKVERKDSPDALKVLKTLATLLNSYDSIPSAAAGLGIAGANQMFNKWTDAQNRLPPAIAKARQDLIKSVSTDKGKKSNVAIANQIQKRLFSLIS